MRRTGVWLVCVLVMSASAACSSGDDTRSTAQPTAAVATPSATPCAVEGATTESREQATEQVGPVVDVRQTAEGCPRVVFEFKDNVSGYKVAYKEPPFSECGSGAEVDTAAWNAHAFIDVRLFPSGGPDVESDSGEPYYKGPRDIAVDGAILKHLKVVCDFEGVFEWVVGLKAEHGFEVTTFEDPPRLVIDISEA
jgi:hypothetical protein